MLVYKALYSKLMDGLKDAGMWIDWAEQLKAEQPEIAQFLCESAKVRLETDFPKTYEHFKVLCESSTHKDGECMNSMVEEHMMDWYEHLLNKIKKW